MIGSADQLNLGKKKPLKISGFCNKTLCFIRCSFYFAAGAVTSTFTAGACAAAVGAGALI